MKQLPSRQRGYLLEVPLLLAAVGIVLAIVLPLLPKTGRAMALAAAAVPVVLCLRYMILTPGWMPGNRRNMGPVLRWALFLPVAAVIISGAVLILMSVIPPWLPQAGARIPLLASPLLIMVGLRYLVFTPALVAGMPGRRGSVVRWGLSALVAAACVAVVALVAGG